MEANETVGIAVSIFLIIVVGVVAFMENRLKHYRGYLNSRQRFRLPKRKIVCLCGSTKFKEAFEKANREETAKGNIVLTVAMFGHLEGLDMDSNERKTFDAVHYDKIELADEILVLNIDGYIGESTKSEIEYAKSLNKVIRYI